MVRQIRRDLRPAGQGSAPILLQMQRDKTAARRFFQRVPRLLSGAAQDRH